MENRNIIEDDEIDLVSIFYKLRAYWYYIVLCTAIGGLLGSAYCYYRVTPMYESTSVVYLNNINDTLSLANLQLSSELSKDYEIIIKSRPNLVRVIDDLSLEFRVDELADMVNVSTISDTHILNITVKSKDPYLSRDIVNAVTDAGLDTIRELSNQDPYVVEKGIPNNLNVGNSVKKIIAISSLAGSAIAVMIIAMTTILFAKVESIEDLESIIDAPVLGTIAETKKFIYKGRKKKGHKHE